MSTSLQPKPTQVCSFHSLLPLADVRCSRSRVNRNSNSNRNNQHHAFRRPRPTCAEKVLRCRNNRRYRRRRQVTHFFTGSDCTTDDWTDSGVVAMTLIAAGVIVYLARLRRRPLQSLPLAMYGAYGNRDSTAFSFTSSQLSQPISLTAGVGPTAAC